VSVLTDSQVEFGLIPREHWFQPDWIDEERATAERNKMAADNVIYGGMSICLLPRAIESLPDNQNRKFIVRIVKGMHI
jgi:hypothetical protein